MSLGRVVNQIEAQAPLHERTGGGDVIRHVFQQDYRVRWTTRFRENVGDFFGVHVQEGDTSSRQSLRRRDKAVVLRREDGMEAR